MKTTEILLTAILGVLLSAVTVFATVAPPPAQPITPVPEPSTLALLGIGLAAGLGYKTLRKKRD